MNLKVLSENNVASLRNKPEVKIEDVLLSLVIGRHTFSFEGYTWRFSSLEKRVTFMEGFALNVYEVTFNMLLEDVGDSVFLVLPKDIKQHVIYSTGGEQVISITTEIYVRMARERENHYDTYFLLFEHTDDKLKALRNMFYLAGMHIFRFETDCTIE